MADSTSPPAQPAPSMRATLLALVERSRADQQAFLDGLSEAERAETGTLTHWSAKDHLAHIAAWKRELASALTALRRGSAPVDVQDGLAFNDRVYEAWRERSWAETLDEADRVNAVLATLIQLFTEEELTAAGRFAWRDGQPIYVPILGNLILHPVEHYTQFATDRGRLDRATALQRAMVETFATTLPDAQMYTYALYNLGCFYAKTGQAPEALEALREAFARDANLIELSRRDPDLDSLRGEPAYQALYI